VAGLISHERGFEARGASRQLVVLLHASGQTTGSMASVAVAAQYAMPDADTWLPPLPISNVLTRSRGADLTEQITRGIAALVAARTSRPDGAAYQDIILVGHSFGAALARAVWAGAMGGQPDGSADLNAAQPWARLIRRIILLAAVARGWNQLAPVTTGVRIAVWLAGALEVVTGPEWAMLDIRRGAPWLTTTRLQTIAIGRAPDAVPPVTVQLLGNVDDVVAPSDNVDLAAGANFYYVQVPGTDHLNVVHFGGETGSERRALFLKALTGSATDLSYIAVKAAVLRDMVDEKADDHDDDHVEPDPESPPLPPARVHPEVERVVFLTHGIRDYGHWTRRLSVHIKELARERKVRLRTVTSSYGFFPMGPFVVKAERRKRAGWLLDQYVTARAMYPNATFSFIGHSNGTYLAATALKTCPAIRFDNVVFAGSVVRQSFEWDRLLQLQPWGERKPQVGRVLNYVATGDWVVALLPGGMEWMRFPDPDLGGAGHHGFRHADERVHDIFYVPGGHDAALKDHHWSEISGFVLGDPFPPAEDKRGMPHRDAGWTPILGILGKASWLVLGALVFIAGLVLAWLVSLLVGWGAAAAILGLPLLTLLSLRVLTRL
jgi:alpha-beta hydrolase superfamily lysophospholipase